MYLKSVFAPFPLAILLQTILSRDLSGVFSSDVIVNPNGDFRGDSTAISRAGK